MIDVQGLTKRFGTTLAVADLSFEVQEGRVTGFLGPNGAGKSTTMRMILGLDTPTAGRARVNGQRHHDLPAPLRELGAMLDAEAVHRGRTARDHLLGLARSNGIAARRVDEVLDLAGLSDVAGRRVGTFSLGMRQRLGIAAALLGDPAAVMFDEPMNGLDTDGIRWIRDLLRGLAAQGRTVFLSSHLMSEMELVADHVVVIGRGRLIADTTIRDLIERNSQAVTLVRTPEPAALRAVLDAVGADMQLDLGGAWRVSGPDAAAIGELAVSRGIALHELTPHRSSLEDVYTQMTRSSVEYRTATTKETAHQ